MLNIYMKLVIYGLNNYIRIKNAIFVGQKIYKYFSLMCKVLQNKFMYMFS